MILSGQDDPWVTDSNSRSESYKTLDEKIILKINEFLSKSDTIKLNNALTELVRDHDSDAVFDWCNGQDYSKIIFIDKDNSLDSDPAQVDGPLVTYDTIENVMKVRSIRDSQEKQAKMSQLLNSVGQSSGYGIARHPRASAASRASAEFGLDGY